MSSRKITTQQERFTLVNSFLKSGKSHKVWCQENDIKPNTLYRWRMEYNIALQHDVCFVPLEPKASKNVHSAPQEASKNNALIELGPCKIHVSEQVAVSLLTSVLKEVVELHV